MRWTIASLSLLLACEGGPADTSSPTDGVTDQQVTDSGETGGPTDNAKEDGTRFDGTVVDSAGTPVEGASILFCQAICLTDETDAQGRFGFPAVPSGWTAFEVIAPLGSGLATGFVPVIVVEDEDRDVNMTLPALDDAQAIPATPTELEIGTGLFVTVSDDALEPPTFVEDATETSGRLLDAADYPPLDFEEGSILAIWYMKPFNHRSKAGMPVAFANQWKLADGEVYRVWQGSYDDQAWLDMGTVTVSGDRIEGDAKLSLTSTTMLVGPITE